MKGVEGEGEGGYVEKEKEEEGESDGTAAAKRGREKGGARPPLPSLLTRLRSGQVWKFSKCTILFLNFLNK